MQADRQASGKLHPQNIQSQRKKSENSPKLNQILQQKEIKQHQFNQNNLPLIYPSYSLKGSKHCLKPKIQSIKENYLGQNIIDVSKRNLNISLIGIRTKASQNVSERELVNGTNKKSSSRQFKSLSNVPLKQSPVLKETNLINKEPGENKKQSDFQIKPILVKPNESNFKSNLTLISEREFQKSFVNYQNEKIIDREISKSTLDNPFKQNKTNQKNGNISILKNESERSYSVGIRKLQIFVTPSKLDNSNDKLKKFNQLKIQKINSGENHETNIKNIHQCLQMKELGEILEQKKEMNKNELILEQTQNYLIEINSIQKHDITKEYRTKMVDWMIEVCSSFRCTQRTYFLSTKLFDRYLLKKQATGVILQNKDVHSIGVTSMYLASKYEDIFPLHSKVVSQKIAHGAISPQELISIQTDFLKFFDFQIDFTTHYDFYQTYSEKIKTHLQNENKDIKLEKLEKITYEMCLILIKMAIQNIDFCKYSQSILVISAFYASTAFLKHSQLHQSPQTSKFCSNIRKIIFEIVKEEKNELDQCIDQNKLEEDSELFNTIKREYINQFKEDIIEKIAIELIDFCKIFDQWHCGLNQLKKFNKIPLNKEF